MPRLCRCTAVAFALVASTPIRDLAHAADVHGKRFDPPRIYFTHATLNKGSISSGIKGQDNYLCLYFPPVDNGAKKYSPEGFSCSVLLPDFVEVLDQGNDGLSVSPCQMDGRPYQRATRPFDAKTVGLRCFRAKYGVDTTLWYRMKEDAAIPRELPEIRVTLTHKGKPCFTDTARLKIYDELTVPPRVSPKHFRLWLHYGPHRRRGHSDELADYLRKAGINAIQFTVYGPQSLDYVKAMRERGFYAIVQRSGSYARIYKDNMRGCLTRGQEWFREADTSTMETYLPHADAVLWDFEPSPLRVQLDDWTVARFREAQRISESEPLTEETIKAKHLRHWGRFRQDQCTACVEHWANFCRSVKPDVETILTEGRANVFDPPGQIDYLKCGKYVTFCDPMNFVGVGAVHIMKQWMARAPHARFTGCHNVGLSSHHNVFISAKTIMLQVLSAALIGSKGNGIYPGPAMDAENFVLLNRVMGLMGRHEQLMFEGTCDPANAIVTTLPKEDYKIGLGDGRKIRNTYPDWSHDAILRSYRLEDSNEHLTVVANWNAKEPCYLKLTMSVADGRWLVVDHESRQVFTQNGSPGLASDALHKGLFLRCPPFDYRGFHVLPDTSAARRQTQDYRQVSLARLASEAQAYVQSGRGSGEGLGQGDLRLDFDDFDRNSKFEFLVHTPDQKVWVSQHGTVAKWTVAGHTIETDGLGLCRDMIWLPQVERANAGMDAVMKLESRDIRNDGVALTFSKSVSLDAVSGMVSLKVEKELFVSREPGRLTVRVRILNTSLAMDTPAMDLSYRVHSYIDYGRAKTAFWVDDGTRVSQWTDVEKHYTVPNADLAKPEAAHIFAQCEVTEPHRTVGFGDYFPSEQLLLTVRPRRPEQILQLLRWGRRANVAGSGTIEWMYRPHPLAQGKDVSYEYQILLTPGVSDLGSESTQPTQETEAEPLDPGLLFHLDFNGSPDAIVFKGIGDARVTGTPVYEDTPGGKAVRVTKGVELSFLPQGNIDLQKGKLHIRFKPLWDGTDGKTHYLLTVRPKSGFLYFGKLADGRFLLNMFDERNQQHYPWHMIRTLEAQTWHSSTVTWDAGQGAMALYFDGKKVAEHGGKPWHMAELDNRLNHCRIVIPETAEAVIDEIKIWGQP